jgi:hypothetical protein
MTPAHDAGPRETDASLETARILHHGEKKHKTKKNSMQRRGLKETLGCRAAVTRDTIMSNFISSSGFQ